ncbi:MAG: efflux RND transporter periplasmic adaptor subunit [Syntrophorhabdaceae bacterium]|nr:efflux RND transporter periplasmic adaptor subunit [Syntrophorhabdaceae bacterium]MDD4196487.1 efflux RND transporter periplasmic adaptor subunit [Syntrophorhabdaceae bacterium]HOC46058.1 efflux RND transporter periplasmic adaptor subunit [Syntrophorhabdaceae bacterium]
MADEDLSKLKIDKTQPAFRKSGKRKGTYLIAGIVLAILVILALAGVFSPAVRVDVVSVQQFYPAQSFTLLNASGYVVPQRKAAVASKITARLQELFVEEGSRVKKDQVLARLENADLAATLRQAEANLNVTRSAVDQASAELHDARVNFEREKHLLAKEFTTRSVYDAAEARYKKALAAFSGAKSQVRASEAAVREAKVSVEYTYIRSPFNGVVLTKNADIGDIVTPIGAASTAKAAVVTLADLSTLKVEADVSESNLGKLKLGEPCQIQLDAIPDERFDGTVHMIVPTADRTKATVMVKVSFTRLDPRILPEMSAKVAFLSREVSESEKISRLAVNRKAVVEKNGRKYIFVVRQGRAVLTEVTTRDTFGDMIEIKSGAASGDKVVLNPLSRLSNGSRVKINE